MVDMGAKSRSAGTETHVAVQTLGSRRWHISQRRQLHGSNPSREHRVPGSALLGVGGVVARNNVNVNHRCLSHTITASRAPSAVISSGSTTEARQTHREEHEARARTTPVLCAAVGRRTTMWPQPVLQTVTYQPHHPQARHTPLFRRPMSCTHCGVAAWPERLRPAGPAQATQRT